MPSHRYYGPLRLPRTPAGPWPAFEGATPRQPRVSHVPAYGLPHVPIPLPRRSRGTVGFMSLRVTAFPRYPRGRHRVKPFEACSGFTRVWARVVASPLPKRGVLRKLRHGQLPGRTVPVATGAYRQFPGRISHPLAVRFSWRTDTHIWIRVANSPGQFSAEATGYAYTRPHVPKIRSPASPRPGMM